MLLPKQYGGPQIDFEIFAKIIRKVAYHNISAAWLTYFTHFIIHYHLIYHKKEWMKL